jgi:hypothetical protein
MLADNAESRAIRKRRFVVPAKWFSVSCSNIWASGLLKFHKNPLAAKSEPLYGYGGRFFLQHWVTRSLLWCYGDMPLNYVRFLDYATSRIFLRRVGGGYSFVHRMLLDHFAKSARDVAGVEPPSRGGLMPRS